MAKETRIERGNRLFYSELRRTSPTYRLKLFKKYRKDGKSMRFSLSRAYKK